MGVCSACMSQTATIIYAILFIACFPAIWLFAWWLDRVWPTTTELLARRGRGLKQVEDIPD